VSHSGEAGQVRIIVDALKRGIEDPPVSESIPARRICRALRIRPRHGSHGAQVRQGIGATRQWADAEAETAGGRWRARIVASSSACGACHLPF